MRLLLTFGIVLLLISCEKTPVEPALEPFTYKILLNPLGPDSLVVETDRIILEQWLRVIALRNRLGIYSNFSWSITGGERKEGDAFSQFVGSSRGYKVGDVLDLTLFVERAKRANDPSDDGLDTVVKKLTVIADSAAMVLGRYKGLFDQDRSRLDTQIVDIRLMKYFFPDKLPALFNLPKGCNLSPTFPNDPYWWSYPGYLQLTDRAGILLGGETTLNNDCKGRAAYFTLSPTNSDSILINYSYLANINDPNVRVNDKFRGIRIK